MKATGIVRRVDDLGRIVIPKEIRRTLRIKDGDPLEIFVQDGGVFYKKYQPFGDLIGFAQSYSDSLYKTTGHICFITDKDNVIAVAGLSKGKYIQKTITSDLGHILEDKILYSSSTEIVNIIDEQSDEFTTGIIQPIISEGEVIGSVILVNKNKVDMGEVEKKLVQNATTFLGKQLED